MEADMKKTGTEEHDLLRIVNFEANLSLQIIFFWT